MSEVDARPPPSRGRSTTRGGRGGFGRGGPRGGRKPVNGTSDPTPVEESLEDQGELGEMKRKYASELGMLKDMFPDWTDVDLVFALEEADGDVPATVDHITQGNVSQFAEVKSNKDRARSKAKEDPAAVGANDKSASRGGRGRGGFEGVRGGRGRGSDRGRGGFRGARGGHATTNGTAKDAPAASVPTTESSAWDSTDTAEATNGGWDSAAADTTKEVTVDAGQGSWGDVVTAADTPAAASEGVKSSLIPEGGAKKSWASMFSQPKPAPAPAKQASVPAQAPASAQPPPAELVASGEVPAMEDESVEAQEPPEPEPEPVVPSIEEPSVEVLPEASPLAPPSIDGEDLAITPSKDPLTEANVEHLLDESRPPATQTAASTVGSVDTRNLTPLPNHQPGPIGSRPPLGGYATSAYRATGQPGRSASFQRRVQEQQEAVVMPGHNAVDRATVQFGSMGLNGEPGPDVDEDREEPETQQALQHSPPSQPRTSLPPAPAQAQEAVRPPQGLPTPKQAPGLPPASQHNQQQMQEATMASSLTQDQTQVNPSYNQYARYGQPSMQQDSGAQQQKPYDPFSHQAQPGQYDPYGTQQQAQQQQQPQPQQQPSHGGFGALSSAPSEYQSYYTSNDQQRQAYNQYYGGGFGQQDTRGQQSSLQQDAGLSQQRSASGFGAGLNESAYAAQAQQQVSTFTSSHVQQQSQAAGHKHSLSEESARKDSKYPMSMLPGSKAAPERMPAVHPDVQAEVAARAEADALQNKEWFSLRPLQDFANRQPPALLTSPLPKVYLSSPSNTLSQQAPSRYGEIAGSGQNTPNPLLGGQQQQQAAQHAQQSQQHALHQAQGAPQQQQQQPQQPQQQQQQGGYGQAAGFPYGHPYYQSPYQTAYANQFGYSPGTGGGYGGQQQGGYPTKQQQPQQQQGGGGMYGAPSGYGNMASHSQYEQHASSPANAGAFGQNQQQSSMRSASGMSSGLGGGLDEYGRSSAQTASHQSSGGFGGINDPFARSTSGFGAQQGGYGPQQQSMGQPEDSLKPYTDTSKSGPSPALGQPGRPGSAANSAAGSNQSGLPPPQSHQQSGFGGYPGFPGQGSQYGSLGGLGSHQQQGQQSANMGGGGGYGAYGAGGFSQYGGAYGSQQPQQQQQQRGGWGSNYGAH